MPRALHHGHVRLHKPGMAKRMKDFFGQDKIVHGLGLLSMVLGMAALPMTLVEPMVGGCMALAAMLVAGFASLHGELRYTMIATAMATMELFWLSSEFDLAGTGNTLLVLAIALPYVWSMICLKVGLGRIQARECAAHRSQYLM